MPLVAKDESALAQAPALDAPGLRELEARAGVFNVDALLAERARLADELAPLDAVCGPGGMGEHQISQYKYALMFEHRARLLEGPGKVTEGMVEEAAKSDPRYVAKLQEFERLRMEYVTVKAAIDNVTTRIQWAMALLRYAASEPRG